MLKIMRPVAPVSVRITQICDSYSLNYKKKKSDYHNHIFCIIFPYLVTEQEALSGFV